MSEIEELLEMTRKRAGIRLRMEVLRGKVQRAIRLLESRLVEALVGDSLRGLRSLVPAEAGRFLAANVRGDRRFGIDKFLPIDGSEELCVSRRGTLVMARQTADGPAWREARDGDLYAEDLERVLGAVREVLRRHVAGSSEDRTRRLSEQVDVFLQAFAA